MDHDSEASLTTGGQLKLTDTSLKITAIYAIIGGLHFVIGRGYAACMPIGG